MITQRFPFLLPLRTAQRKAFFYAGMRLDGQAYAQSMQDTPLQHKLFSCSSGLYNTGTGFDMVYQENKVFNLKLTAKALHGLLIRPGETFSFWQAVRGADKDTAYKDGLTVTNGELSTAPGGGLCQMSNLLFWLFLHAPLTIVERHTHKVKDFPTMRSDEPEGVDATIHEGWLDLKVKNETDTTFQIHLAFDDTSLKGSLYADKPARCTYEILGKDMRYFRENGAVFQSISIYRRERCAQTRALLAEKLLYINVCKIGYELPEETAIGERGRVHV